MITSSIFNSHLLQDGFAVVEDVVSLAQIQNLLTALEDLNHQESIRIRGGMFAVRNLLEVSPVIRELASSIALRNLVEPVLGLGAFPVRGILFDKIPKANWKVPWHQDVTIAVQEKIETKEFGPWSPKAGVLHVQPPASVLENMLSVRIHLDDCGETNGALKVIPASHLRGRLSDDEVQHIRETQSHHTCEVNAGGALLMRPLLLHASSPSTMPLHRRVVHIDYAASLLPNGLRWLSQE